MRGNTFMCYVNGHFVGSDTVDGVASSGQAGIYMNTSVTEGVFSNFAVYPLPHDMPLLL